MPLGHLLVNSNVMHCKDDMKFLEVVIDVNLSSYYDLKRQCYEKVKNIPEALVEAKHAVENCKDGKYKLTLENTLLRLEAL